MAVSATLSLAPIRRATDHSEGALWYGHLAGFARASATQPAAATLDRLTAGFALMAASVEAAGGRILKLCDDGLIAVFPSNPDGEGAACRRALDAALQVHQGLARLELDDGRQPLRAEITLHLGHVELARIETGGQSYRVALGPDAVLAGAIRPLGAYLKRPILASQAFAEALEATAGPKLERLGTYSLRGLTEPQEIFATPVPPDLEA